MKSLILLLFLQGQWHLRSPAGCDYFRAEYEMENKTKDVQIHATGGSVKKLLHTPTQCRPHTCTHNNAHIQIVPYKETHTYTNKCTHILGAHKPART